MASPRLRLLAMAVTLVGIAGLIVTTATLRGPAGATIQTVPLVVLDLRPTEVIAAVHGAFDQVRYARITIVVRGLTNLSFGLASTQNDTYGAQTRIPRSAASAFDVNVTVFDHSGNGFRWRGTVFVDRDAGGEFMAVTTIMELRSVKVYSPATFRTLIPVFGVQ